MATPENNLAGMDLVITNPATIARFAEMVALLPRADDDDGGAERIIEAILNAQTWEDLDAPWRARGGEAYKDVPQRILGAKIRPSDFGQGLGVYVVVDAVDMRNGESITWTTGSVSIVAQLVRAHCVGAFPLLATLRVAERPSKAGNFPQHLEVTDSGGKGVVDAEPAPAKGKGKAAQAAMDEPAPY
jgi:hypothetical protein